VSEPVIKINKNIPLFCLRCLV